MPSTQPAAKPSIAATRAVAAANSTNSIPPSRQSRELSKAELKVHGWVTENHGVISRVARELNLSPQFVHRVAYNREARSKGLVVERRLLELKCPLIQRIS